MAARCKTLAGYSMCQHLESGIHNTQFYSSLLSAVKIFRFCEPKSSTMMLIKMTVVVMASK